MGAFLVLRDGESSMREPVGALCSKADNRSLPEQFLCEQSCTLLANKNKLEVLRERRPPPNASISDNPVNPDFGLRTPGSGR